MLSLWSGNCTTDNSDRGQRERSPSPGSVDRNRFLITGSEAPNVFGWGYKTRRQYHDILVRKLKGERPDDDGLHPILLEKMQQGVQMEPFGISLFEKWTGRKVTKTKTYAHPSVPWLCATPDALVGDDGVLEVKFRTNEQPPYTMSHPAWLKFYIQIQMQLQCTQRRVGYYLGLSLVCPCVLVEVERDDKTFKELFLPLMEQFIQDARDGKQPNKGIKRINVPIMLRGQKEAIYDVRRLDITIE